MPLSRLLEHLGMPTVALEDTLQVGDASVEPVRDKAASIGNIDEVVPSVVELRGGGPGLMFRR